MKIVPRVLKINEHVDLGKRKCMCGMRHTIMCAALEYHAYVGK